MEPGATGGIWQLAWLFGDGRKDPLSVNLDSFVDLLRASWADLALVSGWVSIFKAHLLDPEGQDTHLKFQNLTTLAAALRGPGLIR